MTKVRFIGLWKKIDVFVDVNDLEVDDIIRLKNDFEKWYCDIRIDFRVKGIKDYTFEINFNKVEATKKFKHSGTIVAIPVIDENGVYKLEGYNEIYKLDVEPSIVERLANDLLNHKKIRVRLLFD